MPTAHYLRRQLLQARQFSESLLRDLRHPDDWTYRVHDRGHHALWFAGHMALTDDFFISVLDPPAAHAPGGYLERFGMGSQPTADAADYPPIDQVLDFMRERRQVLLDLLERYSDADLAQPTRPGTPEFLPDVAAVFMTALWHEGMHAGQLTVIHRALGHLPLMAPERADG